MADRLPSRTTRIRDLDKTLQHTAADLLAFYESEEADGLESRELAVRAYDVYSLMLALRGQLGSAMTRLSGAPLRGGGIR